MDIAIRGVHGGGLRLFELDYEELTSTHSDELYRLRKKTFSDRLGWDVTCCFDMEFDEFDNADTRYIIGMVNDQLICSVRFIKLEQPNMITHTFQEHFQSIELPKEGTESSRFFVDKERARHYLGERYPIAKVLFLAMINSARYYGYAGIHTIVSRSMLTILKRSGWQIEVLKEASLSEKEKIYLLFLPTTERDQYEMASQVASSLDCPVVKTESWPLTLPV